MAACTELRQGPPADVVTDLAADVTVDAQPDLPVDASPDVTADARPDVAADARPDATADVTADATLDAALDVALDAPDPVRITAPRPVAPLSGAWMTTGRVTFRWQPLRNQQAVVQVCADRACTRVEQTLDGMSGDRATVSTALAQGSHWWRLYGVAGGARGLTPGPTWHLVVDGRVDAPATTAGPMLDLDGDGRRDLAVGASGAAGGAGRLRVWLATTGFLTGDRQLGGVLRRGAGTAVAPAGDLDGDGLGELAYAALEAPYGDGEVILVRGSREGTTTPLTTLSLGFMEGSYGRTVAGVGDLDGDGYGDVAVGQPQRALGDRGRVFVYAGGANGLRGWDGRTRAVPTWTLQNFLTENGHYGQCVAALGDVNGDGFDDLGVGSVSEPMSAYGGEVMVHLGGPTGPSTTPLRLASPDPAAMYFGAVVAGLGDVNGDGLADLAVNAMGYGQGRPRVHVYYGTRTGPRATPDLSLTTPDGIGNYGAALAGVGDIDRDGFGDLAVSSAGARRVYVYRGSATGLDPAGPYTLEAPEMSSAFAQALGTRGDLDGDGAPDLVVGAWSWSMATGRAWVFRGARGGPEPMFWRRLEGTETGARFGEAL